MSNHSLSNDGHPDDKRRDATRKDARQRRLGRFALATAVCVFLIVGSLALLRQSVRWVSDEPPRPSATRVSRGGSNHYGPNSAESISERKRQGSAFRAKVIQDEDRFMRERKHRIWAEQNRSKPDHRDAFSSWKTKVERIEAKIEEVSQLEGAYDEEGNVVENSLLWHHMQRLEVLKADAPPAY